MTGDIATVILWHGQYRNDGLEVLNHIVEYRLPGLKNLRLEGAPTRWFLVADAVIYQP